MDFIKDFKGTFEEAIEYYSENWEEINPDLDFEDLTPIQVSKVDFSNGFIWYKNKSKEKELIEMLKRSIKEINHLKAEYKDVGHCGKYIFECEKLLEETKS